MTNIFIYFESLCAQLNSFLWGWPLIIFIGFTGIAFTVLLNGIQFRYFIASWRYLLAPEQGGKGTEISPLQAFLNALSASLGNGSLTGMATALYSGGPGAAFWVCMFGLISMPIRFAEVFCGTTITMRTPQGVLRGGPLAYISQTYGGSILVYIYVFCMLWLTLASGCAMQCQSITTGLVNITGLPAYIFGILLVLFLLFAILGGGKRILQLSDIIVPLKVALFFLATGIALLYHAGHILPALSLMLSYAFTPAAVAGGAVGYSLQTALRFGISRVANATEAGLGTAGILYGATGSKQPVKSGIMAMATTAISNLLVCFNLMLLMIASGVWNSGLYGTTMTIAAYSTVFGSWGAPVVTLLSLLFGLGVLVTYIYIGKECWNFLTDNKGYALYAALFCTFAYLGATINAPIIWNLVDISNSGLLAINLYALWCLIPVMRTALAEFARTART